MRIQFQIFFWLACVNLAIGTAFALQVPGTEYVMGTNPANATDYETHFNATEVSKDWKPNDVIGIPIIGDVFSMFQFLGRNIGFILDGLPMLLTWIGDTYFTDSSARLAFDVIANVLRALYGILIFFFVIEFISGRNPSD